MSIYGGTKWFNKRIEDIFVVFHFVDELHVVLVCMNIGFLWDGVDKDKGCENALSFFIFLVLWDLCFDESWYFDCLSGDNLTNVVLSELAKDLSGCSVLGIDLLYFDSLNECGFEFLFF